MNRAIKSNFRHRTVPGNVKVLLKFFGARSAFFKVTECKVILAGHRTTFTHIGRLPQDFV